MHRVSEQNKHTRWHAHILYIKTDVLYSDVRHACHAHTHIHVLVYLQRHYSLCLLFFFINLKEVKTLPYKLIIISLTPHPE